MMSNYTQDTRCAHRNRCRIRKLQYPQIVLRHTRWCTAFLVAYNEKGSPGSTEIAGRSSSIASLRACGSFTVIGTPSNRHAALKLLIKDAEKKEEEECARQALRREKSGLHCRRTNRSVN